jgi:hypothetical protein
MSYSKGRSQRRPIFKRKKGLGLLIFSGFISATISWHCLQFERFILYIFESLRGGLWFSSGVSTKEFFTFDEIKIPTKFYPNFVAISMFWFSGISISMSKSKFRLWLFTFDEIKIRNSDEISIWFRLGFDVKIVILISISPSEFRFWFRFRHQIPDFSTIFQFQCQNFIAFFTEISQHFRAKFRRN